MKVMDAFSCGLGSGQFDNYDCSLKCTSRLDRENSGVFLCFGQSRLKQNLVEVPKARQLGPQFMDSLKLKEQEKSQDWLAEGVGFEPTRPFRA